MTDETGLVVAQGDPPVTVALLGPVAVHLDGTAMALGGSKPRSVLALLALSVGTVVPTSRLIEQVWEDPDDVERARGTLQVHVSNLRRALAPVAAAMGLPGVLEAVRPGYRLALPPACVDVERAIAWLEGARRARTAGQGERAVALARAASGLWRGEPLADLAAEPWVEGSVARLRSLRTEVDLVRVEAELDLGRHGEVLTDLAAMLARSPYDERLRVLGMSALYRAGRHAESLALAAEGRRVLGEDLGLEPGPELRAMEDRVLRHDPGLAWAGPASVDGPTLLAPRRSRARAVLLVGEREVVLGDVATIGRHPGCHVVCDDGLVSRRHAELRRSDGGDYELRDLGSTNGTHLNGRPLDGVATLQAGDVLELGAQRLVFEVR